MALVRSGRHGSGGIGGGGLLGGHSGGCPAGRVAAKKNFVPSMGFFDHTEVPGGTTEYGGSARRVTSDDRVKALRGKRRSSSSSSLLAFEDDFTIGSIGSALEASASTQRLSVRECAPVANDHNSTLVRNSEDLPAAEASVVSSASPTAVTRGAVTQAVSMETQAPRDTLAEAAAVVAVPDVAESATAASATSLPAPLEAEAEAFTASVPANAVPSVLASAEPGTPEHGAQKSALVWQAPEFKTHPAVGVQARVTDTPRPLTRCTPSARERVARRSRADDYHPPEAEEKTPPGSASASADCDRHSNPERDSLGEGSGDRRHIHLSDGAVRRKRVTALRSEVASRKVRSGASTLAPKRSVARRKNGDHCPSVQRMPGKAIPAVTAPYGANYVRQERASNGRLKRKSASAGTTKSGKMARKYFNSNGSLKPKYARPPDADVDYHAGMSYTKARKIRFHNLKEQALAARTLSGIEKETVGTFSSSVTQELLSSVDASAIGVDIGEVASHRPPDATCSAEASAVLGDGLLAKMASDVPRSTSVSFDPEVYNTQAGCKSHVGSELARAPESGCKAGNVDAMNTVVTQSSYSGADNIEIAAADGECTTLGLARRAEDLSADDLRHVLREHFGHDSFRPGQQEAISAVLGFEKTLLLLSTGAGKSLCYQIPAFLLREEGITLVISPLVSLMSDQLLRLPHCLRGAIVSGQQTKDQSMSVMRAVRARLVDVLFISPERLSMWSFDGCGLPPVALACIDEAHCVSEWSHNFRPDYLRLHEFLVGVLRASRLLGLTATATRPTIRSICDILQLDRIVRSDRSFTLQELLEEPAQPRVQRTNLMMEVRCTDSEEQQINEVIHLLRSEENARKSVIVYVWRRITADRLAKQLRVCLRGGVSAYHGSMLPEARRAVQDSFMTGRTRIVIATMAFGMGLDKSDIRMVIHFNVPKSIENYIQETGRCSRDGKPGHCVAFVNPKDYKVIRWISSGAGGSNTQVGMVRRLLHMILNGGAGPHKRYALSTKAMTGAETDAAVEERYNVAFEERDMAKALNCPPDELHSVLAHFSHRARGYVTLYSKFPTKMKLRFFKTDPDELAKIDPLLRKVLPLAKKCAGVHTIELAQVLAELGGEPGQLSNGLWHARGDEFSIEKADYGYMISVLRNSTEAQVEDWTTVISGINARARVSTIDKLDAVYIALRRAGETGSAARVRGGGTMATAGDEDGGHEHKDRLAQMDHILNTLIDSYFACTGEDASATVAGDTLERARLLREALGEEHRAATERPRAGPLSSKAYGPASTTAGKGLEGSQLGGASAGSLYGRELRERNAVYLAVARLVMSSEWPSFAVEDPSGPVQAAAQVLAGIGSMQFPARKWCSHTCWGRFRELGDFAHLVDLVAAAYERLRSLQASAKSAEREAARCAQGA